MPNGFPSPTPLGTLLHRFRHSANWEKKYPKPKTMNRNTLTTQYLFGLILSIGLLSPVMATDPEPSETPSATPTPIIKGGCNLSSWNTEVYRFYGARDSII